MRSKTISSKLRSGKWPNPNGVAKKVVKTLRDWGALLLNADPSSPSSVNASLSSANVLGDGNGPDRRSPASGTGGAPAAAAVTAAAAGAAGVGAGAGAWAREEERAAAGGVEGEVSDISGLRTSDTGLRTSAGIDLRRAPPQHDELQTTAQPPGGGRAVAGQGVGVDRVSKSGNDTGVMRGGGTPNLAGEHYTDLRNTDDIYLSSSGVGSDADVMMKVGDDCRASGIGGEGVIIGGEADGGGSSSEALSRKPGVFSLRVEGIAVEVSCCALFCAVLCYALACWKLPLCCAVLCCRLFSVLCCAELCCACLYMFCVVLLRSVQCCAVLCCVVCTVTCGALRCVLCRVCFVERAVSCVLCRVCCVVCAVSCMPCRVCRVVCAVSRMPCRVCRVVCAVSYVPCRVCCVCWGLCVDKTAAVHVRSVLPSEACW